jgi:hypothetical protein
MTGEHLHHTGAADLLAGSAGPDRRGRMAFAGSIFALFLIVGGLTAPAKADPITPTVLLTEMLTQDMAENTGFLEILFGADQTSPITFSIFVDPVNLLFSFSTRPGTTYLGQSLVLGGSGSLNSTMGITSLSASGMLGSFAWTTAGSYQLTGDPNEYQFAGTQSLDAAFAASNPGTLSIAYTSVLSTFVLMPNGVSTAHGTYRNADGVDFEFWTAKDTYTKIPHLIVDVDWSTITPRTLPFWSQSVFLNISSDGGAGTNDVDIYYTPEPSDWLLGGAGVLALAGLLCQRRAFFLDMAPPSGPQVRRAHAA